MISQPVFLKSLSLLLIATPLLISDLTLAQTASSSASVQFVPPPPPLQGRPIGSRRGGASRGGCPVGERQLAALVPAAIEPTANGESATELIGGLTTTERPTFWFYLPYALTDDRPGEFILLDDENNYVYQTTIVRPEFDEGIIRVSLPETVAPLAIDRVYSWTFLVNCGTDYSIFTQGYIQRVSPTAALARQLETATAAERVALYANHGIWYDALTTLAELHRGAPNNAAIATDWQTLLQSVGLADLADRPLLECCTPQ